MSQKIHFIGIGGIGMSSLAQLYAHRGDAVSGTDRSPSTQVQEMLAKKGITVFTGHSPEYIPENTDLVVYSDAVVLGSEGFPELSKARERGIQTLSYFEALGGVAKSYRVIAVSGTHGKTTTTGMLGKILIDAGKSPTVVVGSIITDFGSNFVPGNSDILVVEADEYRRHFLNFTPQVLVINNLELDHTDVYPTLEDIVGAFHELAQKVPGDGAIITDPSVPAIKRALDGIQTTVVPYPEATSPKLSLIGSFNENNARAAKAAAQALFPELTDAVVDASLTGFKGSWRRFEYKGKSQEGALIYDDYAHHPTAVALTIKGARERFPDKKIVVAFHPHLYSRTRDLMDEFAAALSLADNVLIAPIFAAREQPLPGVSSETLAEKTHPIIGKAHAFDSLISLEAELLKTLSKDDLLITMGAGDIYTLAERLGSA